MSFAEMPGVHVFELSRYEDSRGWLTELFRDDLMEDLRPGGIHPAMAYISMTRPGITRGPHEHREQTDCFAFLGPSDFEVSLWDNRMDSVAAGKVSRFVFGASRPAVLVVPPGVVHGYRNIGSVDGWVINLPDRLYRGRGRLLDVDEIRHEDDPDGRFRLEDL